MIPASADPPTSENLMTPRLRLGSGFEPLEDRTVPATWGVPWADPSHLTISFVPDGTQTPVGPSVLDQILVKATGSVAAGEQVILRAFQTWAAQSNINVGVVADGGQPLGTTGAVQGDARFGDIRISATSLAPDSAANSLPFSWSGTTLSGDVIFNSNLTYGVGNSSSFYDIYSLAIHEAGHVYGFGDITTPGSNSVMNQAYSYRTGLGASDVTAIQGLYGAPQPDKYANNNTPYNPASIPQASSSGALQATADLGTSSTEYFKFSTPLLTPFLSGVEVRLKASGISLLTAKVTVYDAFGRTVATSQSTDPLNNDLTMKFQPGLLGGTYTIKVEGADNSVFSNGAYKLAVDFLTLGSVLSPITTGLLGGLLGVQTNSAGQDARFDVVARGDLTRSTQVDSYTVSTNKYAPGTQVNLNVMVWGVDSNPLDAQVRVFDSNGNAVAYEVLANNHGLYSIQILNAVAGQKYTVQVFARAGGAQSTGNYFFAADFNQVPAFQFDDMANGTLNAGTATPADTLTMSETGAYQFALGANAAQSGNTVTMSVYDAFGNLVFSLTAVVGQPVVTSTQYLRAGTYYVTYSSANTNIGGTDFGMYLSELSDLSGPYATSTASPTTTAAPEHDNHDEFDIDLDKPATGFHDLDDFDRVALRATDSHRAAASAVVLLQRFLHHEVDRILLLLLTCGYGTLNAMGRTVIPCGPSRFLLLGSRISHGTYTNSCVLKITTQRSARARTRAKSVRSGKSFASMPMACFA